MQANTRMQEQAGSKFGGGGGGGGYINLLQLLYSYRIYLSV